MVNEFVLGVAIILFTGLLFGKLARKLHIPDITGYLIGGLIIGPSLYALILPSFAGIIGINLITTLEVVVDIELGFIAFTVGCEFKLSYFKKVGTMPLWIAIAESFAAVVFITGGMLLFGAPLYFALCMGAVGGATAPAATIMVIRQYKAKGELSQTLLSVTAIDDATALIFFGFATAWAKGIINPGADLTASILMPIAEIFGSVILGAVIGLLLAILIKFFKTGGNRLVLTVAMLFFNIGICLLLKHEFGIGLSPLLASILMGAVFTNISKTVDDVLPLVEGITPPLVVVFFVLAGAGLQVTALTGIAVLMLAVYLVFRVAGKVFGTWLSASATKAPPKVKKWLGFGLLPQGGIAIGLSMLVMQLLDSAPPENLVGQYNGSLVRIIVLCAVFASELFGPILAKMAILKSGEGTEEPREPKRVKSLPAAISGSAETAQELPSSDSQAEPLPAAAKIRRKKTARPPAPIQSNN